MDRLPGILKAYLEVTLKTTALPDLAPLLTVPVGHALSIHVTPQGAQRKVYVQHSRAQNYLVLNEIEYILQAVMQTVNVLTEPSDPNWGILEQFDSVNFGGGFDIKASYITILRTIRPGATIATTSVELGLPGTDSHTPYETTLIAL